MLRYFYVIVILLPLMQTLSVTIIKDSSHLNKHHTTLDKPISNIGVTTPSDVQYEKSDPRFFDTIVEPAPKPIETLQSAKNNLVDNIPKSSPIFKLKGGSDKSYIEIKTLLTKVLEQIEMIEKRSQISLKRSSADLLENNEKASQMTSGLTSDSSASSGNKKSKKLEICKQVDGGNRSEQHHSEEHQKQNIQQAQQTTTSSDTKSKKGIKWGHWTDWSSCSVSCGKGREIRWRHCIENCEEAETEMEEKTCQLPACAPKKIFGMLKV